MEYNLTVDLRAIPNDPLNSKTSSESDPNPRSARIDEKITGECYDSQGQCSKRDC